MDKVITELNRLLADYQVYYQRTRNFHWYVTGPHFFTLHKQFEGLYQAASEAVDTLAERILAIGGKPVSTLADQLRLARLTETDASLDAMDMVKALVEDLAQLNQYLTALADVAGNAGDATTVGLAEALKSDQEKTRWMLKAFTS